MVMNRDEFLADVADETRKRNKQHRDAKDGRWDNYAYVTRTPERKQHRLALAHARLTARRIQLVEHMGSKCADCDTIYPPCVMDAHHRDPSTKEFALNLTHMNTAWHRIVAEAAKCDLLCANCHRIRHHVIKEGDK